MEDTNLTIFLQKKYPNISIAIVLADPQYEIFYIRSGSKRRQIEEPIGDLKIIQRGLVELFQNIPLHLACTAKIGSSILLNAEQHKDSKYFLKIDIKECYRNITLDHILTALPNSLPSIYQDAVKTCMILDAKTERYILPTGAPTSPILCNIAFSPVDQDITNLLNGTNYIYTRYIDDLYISTPGPARDWNLIDKVKDILKKYNLIANNKKIKWMTRGIDPIIITGVQLGNINRVPKELKNMLRSRLQHIAKESGILDEKTNGYLAYVQSLDKEYHKKLMTYYHKRLYYNMDGK